MVPIGVSEFLTGLYSRCRRDPVIPLMVLITILYASSRFGVLITGDSVQNIRQIEAYDIWSRNSHFTFHLFGVLFYRIGHTLFGVSAIATTEAMLMVFSLVAVYAVYQWGMFLQKNRYTAAMTALFYATSSSIWRFSIQAEYLILVPSFMMMAAALFVHRKPVLAGLMLGLAGLASPFASAALPFILYPFRLSKDAIIRTGISGLAAAGLYLLVNALSWEETVGGNWSIGIAVTRFIDAINIAKGMMGLIYGFCRSFHVLIPFACIGIWRIIREDRKMAVAAAATFLLLVPTTLAEARQGAYMQGFYPWVAFAAATGLTRALSRRRAWMTAVLIAGTFLNGMLVYSEKFHARRIIQTYRAINNAGFDDRTLIYLYPSRLPFTYYISKFRTALVKNYTGGKLPVATSISRDDVNEGIVLLIESGIRVPDDFIKERILSFLRGHNIRGRYFGQEVLKDVWPGKKFVKLPGYPLDVYRLK